MNDGINFVLAVHALREYARFYNKTERLALENSGGSFAYYVEEIKTSRPEKLPANCETLDTCGNWTFENCDPFWWGGCVRRWRKMGCELPPLEES